MDTSINTPQTPSIVSLFSTSWQEYKNNFKIFILISLIYQLPSIGVGYLVSSLLFSKVFVGTFSFVQIVDFAVLLILSLFIICLQLWGLLAISYIITSSSQNLRVLDSYLHTVKYVPSLFFLAFIWSVLFLGIPSLLLAIVYSVLHLANISVLVLFILFGYIPIYIIYYFAIFSALLLCRGRSAFDIINVALRFVARNILKLLLPVFTITILFLFLSFLGSLEILIWICFVFPYTSIYIYTLYASI